VAEIAALAEPLAALASVALLTAAGAGLAELVPHLARLGWPRRLGYGYLLGVAWIGGGLFALSHFAGAPLSRTTVVLLAGLPIAAGLAARWRRGPRRLPLRRLRPRAAEVAAIVLGGAVTLGLFADALTQPLADFDGRMTWAAQARYLRAAGTVDAPVLARSRWFVTHPQYPPLLPLAQVAAMELAGSGEDEEPFRPLYAAFFPALLLAVYASARRWTGRGPAAWTAAAAAALPFLSLARDGGAAGAYSDLPLAAFYGAGLALLLGAQPRAGDGWAAGALLAGAALAKNEGAPLALFALAIAAAWTVRRARRRRLPWREIARRLAPHALAAALVLAALALLAAWRAGIPNRFDEAYAAHFGPADLWPAAVARIPAIAPILGRRMAAWRDWALFWWVLPVVFWAGRRGLRGRPASPLALAALAPLGIAWAAYSVHPNLLYLPAVTWDRMLVQGLVPLLLLLAPALRACRSGMRSRAATAG